jgi:CheY-like chemotaxis protein
LNTKPVVVEDRMGENEATVLVAMTPSDRRDRVTTSLRERDHEVVTADDGIDAVDGVRGADAVLVGDYPAPITEVVVDATTPPDVSRPNVLLADDDPEEVQPDERLPMDAEIDAVVAAVERAVERATYSERVSRFSAVAVEAATSDRGSRALAERVSGLAEDARDVQSEFSSSDWAATFRAIATPSPHVPSGFNSGNRTS